ncbi:hypothetical protein [Gimesia aquarii]|uniref:Uncharacterized protein n=1 Tax=Gimesia aquarii TaxID=2527964 RepID=A0A517WR34_9PLAN|nr:hypothetical protein [Gimesia aquarii]QDU07717.1 hypothetical protein V202x_10780 [Gimesia aquarii]
MNIKRGLQKSLLFALVGFLIPTVIFSIPWPTSSDSLTRSERQDQIARQEYLIRNRPEWILHTGLHSAAVFALAAFAAYTPHKGIRFMRSLILISSVTVLSLLLTDIFYPTYKGLHKNVLIDPGISLIAAVVTMVIIVIVSVRKPAAGFTQTLTTNETKIRSSS